MQVMKKIYLIVFLLFIYQAVKPQQVERVTEINYEGYNGLNPRNLTVFNGKLFFFGTDDPEYVDKLMFTDGTAAGVTVVKQIDSDIQYPSLQHLTVLNNLLVFDNKHQLWKSDGTAAGTSKIKDITIRDVNYVVLNNKIYFAGDVTNSNPAVDQLWETDGTENGTKLVKTINSNGPSYIANLVVSGGKIYFNAYGGEGSFSVPWVSDGTEAGTFKLKEITCAYGAGASNFIAYNSKVYFSAADNASGSQLWVTDGTTNGTLKVTNINPGDIGLSPANFILYNSKLFFMGIDRGAFYQLWSTDGTEQGTKLVKTDYTPRTYSGFLPNSMAILNNKLYISGYDSLTATIQLWVSDGTTAGTTKVTSFPQGLSPSRLYAYQNKLIMTGIDTLVNKIEVYVSDGTVAGTVCPPPPSNGVDVFFPWQGWVPFNNALYYRAAYGYFADYQLCRVIIGGTGIEEEHDQQISVYPNPTHELITVNCPSSFHDLSIEVYNSLGSLLFKRSDVRNFNSFDLRPYPTGIYIIKLSSNNHVIATKKIIKD
jgi:ELWxxDGT repeat protein